MAEESYQEKTEPASERKREEARGKGKVVRSVELNSAFVLLFGLLVLYFGSNALVSGLASIARSAFTTIGIPDADRGECASPGEQRGAAHRRPDRPDCGRLPGDRACRGIPAGGVHVFAEGDAAEFREDQSAERHEEDPAVAALAGGTCEEHHQDRRRRDGGLVERLQEVLAETPMLVDSDPAGLLGFIGEAGFSIGLRTRARVSGAGGGRLFLPAVRI